MNTNIMEFDDELDSSSNSGKSEFDEEYFRLQPPTIPVSKSNINIITIKTEEYLDSTDEQAQGMLSQGVSDTQSETSRHNPTEITLRSQINDTVNAKLDFLGPKSYAAVLRSPEIKKDNNALQKRTILIDKKQVFSQEVKSYASILKSSPCDRDKNTTEKQKETSMEHKYSTISNYSFRSADDLEATHNIERESNKTSSKIAQSRLLNNGLKDLNISKHSRLGSRSEVSVLQIKHLDTL